LGLDLEFQVENPLGLVQV